MKKILDKILRDEIVILQGRLAPEEETSLIQSTMALVGRIKKFKGVEIAVINPGKDEEGILNKIKFRIARALVGQRDALTIVGPASLVKEIKRDPRKIDLLLKR